MSITVRALQRAQATAATVATVEEILPTTGLAYVTDADDRLWGITRHTPGSGLTSLRPGQHVKLTVIDHGDFQVVSDYAPLD